MVLQNLVKDYGKEIEWSVASLFAHDRFIWELLKICKVFDIEVPISSVYGSIPCMFQGGRVPTRDASIEDAKAILSKYDELGISCRLTFSNYNLVKEDYSDEKSNILLDTLNSLSNAKHGVIVSRDDLAEYIRDKYPNLLIISSLVKPSLEKCLGNDQFDYYNKLFGLYDLVSVNPYKVNDNVFLSSLYFPERTVFCVNNHCVPNCSYCWKHNDLICGISVKESRGEDCTKDLKELGDLMIECRKVHSSYPLAGNQMSQSEIEYLTRIGVRQFSLEGRDVEGQCFIRDMGDYIFNHYLFNRVASSIMGGTI